MNKILIALAILLISTQANAQAQRMNVGAAQVTPTGTTTSDTVSNWLKGVAMPIINLGVTTSTSIKSSDMGSLLINSSTAAVSLSLPQAGTTGFGETKQFCDLNTGSASVTITPTISTINGNANIVLSTGQYACLISDGANYFALSGQATSGIASTFNATTISGGYQLGGVNGLSNPALDTRSIAIGGSALVNQTATNLNNIAIGVYSGASLTTGNNIAIGSESCRYCTTPTFNTFVGHYTGQTNSSTPFTGARNVAVGGSAFGKPSGSINESTAIGYTALGGASLTGSNNTAIGFAAGAAITSGNSSVLIGDKAGYLITSGRANTILGHEVGSLLLTTGTGNILIGNNNTTGVPASGTSGLLNIGNAVYGNMGTPSLTSCGTAPTIVGNDLYGTVTIGSGGTGCVVTFVTAKPASATCVVTKSGGVPTYSISTSALTITDAAGTVINYSCSGK